MSHALNWFEIPVTDLARAKRFYSAVLQAELSDFALDGKEMAVFPYQESGVGGALLAGGTFAPSTQGTVVYLGAGDDLDGALARVAANGGRVAMGRTFLSESIGSIAFFDDTEGNRVGLHTRH
jgi:predicted enzyme related to lactoylglutathione lyase